MMRFGRPSLLCDFVELYRYLIDDSLIQYCQEIKPRDFIAKTEEWNGKKSKKICLRDSLTNDLTDKTHDYFKRMVKVPRIMRREKQEIERLINAEVLLFAKSEKRKANMES